MRKLFIIIILFHLLLNAIGQKIENLDGATYISDENQELYTDIGINNDGDYRYGFYSINVDLFAKIIQSNPQNRPIYFLTIVELVSKKDRVNFTEVLFEFQDGTKTEWLDFHMKTYSDDSKVTGLTYDVTSYYNDFLNKPISFIYVKNYGNDIKKFRVSLPYAIMRQAKVINKYFVR